MSRGLAGQGLRGLLFGVSGCQVDRLVTGGTETVAMQPITSHGPDLI